MLKKILGYLGIFRIFRILSNIGWIFFGGVRGFFLSEQPLVLCSCLACASSPSTWVNKSQTQLTDGKIEIADRNVSVGFLERHGTRWNDGRVVLWPFGSQDHVSDIGTNEKSIFHGWRMLLFADRLQPVKWLSPRSHSVIRQIELLRHQRKMAAAGMQNDASNGTKTHFHKLALNLSPNES